MAHKDICIQFEIKGRRFEAVGCFLNEDDTMVTRNTMLERTDRDGMIVGEEDWEFIYENRQDFPPELRDYFLVTKRPYPDRPTRLSCFIWYNPFGKWFDFCSHYVDYQWDDNYLVLRRRT